FQYNKRDLANILSVAELEESLNPGAKHESYEACAVVGQGVFETLKAISKLTLRSLKKRMLGEERPSKPITATVAPSSIAPPSPPLASPAPAPSATAPRPAAPPAPKPAAAKPTGRQAVTLKDLSPPPAPPPAAAARAAETTRPKTPPPAVVPPPPPALMEAETFDADDVETVNEFEEALNSLDAPLPEVGLPGEPLEIGEVSFAETPPVEKIEPAQVKHVKVRSNIDILAELEKLRKNTTAASAASPEKPARRPTAGVSIDDLLASSLNH